MNTKHLIHSSLFAALISIGTFIRIPLPFVPITLQVLFIVLASLLLGKKWGTISVLLYVLLGLIGLPVFSNGGGIGYVFQPTFGYLLAFIPASYLIGKLSEKKNAWLSHWIASLSGLTVIYVLGYLYYILIARLYLEISIDPAVLLIHAALIPLPGDLISCLIASFTAVKLRRFQIFQN
ncbi:MAG TPA: biotin transporter BioY [Eubacteriaceae bacterium]|nr:biotin transporter BioY [Eubacteriaceae bacterium]